jgi:hypothetical protein
MKVVLNKWLIVTDEVHFQGAQIHLSLTSGASTRKEKGPNALGFQIK